MDPQSHSDVPSHLSIPLHGSNIVTRLRLVGGRIFAASDDHTVTMHSADSGELLRTFTGHTGGVWDFVVCSSPVGSDHEILATGSTDTTVRIWDVQSGRNTHTFRGHTSTVRCIAQTRLGDSAVVVTGSRDSTLRVWRLPEAATEELGEVDPDANPYHIAHLTGHTGSVRAVATHGSTAVSGSYDNDVRVWDLETGVCKFVLKGHVGKVYSVAIDALRGHIYSGSMDTTIRVWGLNDLEGTAPRVLTNHSSLIGILSISQKTLASGAADATVKIWDLDSFGDRSQSFKPFGECAITCLQHDDDVTVAGGGGSVRAWDTQTGATKLELAKGNTTAWGVAFDNNYYVAAIEKGGVGSLEIFKRDAEGVQT